MEALHKAFVLGAASKGRGGQAVEGQAAASVPAPGKGRTHPRSQDAGSRFGRPRTRRHRAGEGREGKRRDGESKCHEDKEMTAWRGSGEVWEEGEVVAHSGRVGVRQTAGQAGENLSYFPKQQKEEDSERNWFSPSSDIAGLSPGTS